MSRIIATSPVIASAFLSLGLSSGCDAFYTVHEGDLTETTFDDTLPAALETVFSACSAPVRIEGGDTGLDVFDSCDITVMSEEEQVLAIGLATASPFALPSPLPSLLGVISDVPVLLPGLPAECPVLVSAYAEFNALVIEDLSASWSTHNGVAALELEPVFADEPIVTFVTNSLVPGSCWASNFGAALALHLHTKAVLPDGAHSLSVDQLDMDLFVHLEDGGDEVISEMVVDLGSMSVTSDVDLVEDLVVLALGAMGTAESDLDELAEEIFQGSLATATLQQLVDDAIYAELDPSQTVCDVEVTSGELVITTDDKGARQCDVVRDARYLGR